MRRSQRDAGNQPVRNLLTNPGAENTGASLAVRTNIVYNPRGVFLFPEYSLAGAQTITMVTGLGTNPDGITTANRVSYTSGASNPGISFVNPSVSGTQYTVSAWVYHETIPTAGTQGFAQAGVASMSGPPAIAQGTWQRFSWTYTASGTSQIGFRISAPVGNGSFLITGVMAEISPILGTFFDGVSVAVGDFTHSWVGTANASMSYQRALSVLNVSVNQSNLGSAFASSQWASSGSKSLRIVPTTTSADTFADLTPLIAAGVIKPFTTYTIAGTKYLSAPLGGSLNTSRRFRGSNGGEISFAYKTPIDTNVAGPQRHVATFTTGATTAFAFLRVYNGASAGNGDAWWDDLILVEGDYSEGFIDGTKPFSKWDGTANASTSVGYPQQLFDLAGKPSVDLTGVANTGGVAIPVGAYVPRTIYVVYDATGFTSAYQSAFGYGIIGSKGFLHQTAAAGSSSLANRFDFPGGSSNGAIVLGSGRLTRRHVAAFAFNQGLTNVLACLNGAADVSVALNPGSGWDDGRASTTSGTETKAIRALVYYGEHDRATRVAISRYLGTKYSALVA